MRAKEYALTFNFVPPVIADRLLRHRLVDEHLRRHLYAIRADSRTEDELLATAAKCAHVALRLVRGETDHVDHDVVSLIGECSFERREVAAIAMNRLDIRAQRRL